MEQPTVLPAMIPTGTISVWEKREVQVKHLQVTRSSMCVSDCATAHRIVILICKQTACILDLGDILMIIIIQIKHSWFINKYVLVGNIMPLPLNWVTATKVIWNYCFLTSISELCTLLFCSTRWQYMYITPQTDRKIAHHALLGTKAAVINYKRS